MMSGKPGRRFVLIESFILGVATAAPFRLGRLSRADALNSLAVPVCPLPHRCPLRLLGAAAVLRPAPLDL